MQRVYCQKKLVWDKIERAETPFARLWGLMGKKELKKGEGLLLCRCNQVHTFHMRFPIDVLFLSKDMQILKILTLHPQIVGPRVNRAAFVLETRAGSAELFGTAIGDYLTIE